MPNASGLRAALVMLVMFVTLGVGGCAARAPRADANIVAARTELAREMSLRALDREALYTIAPAADGSRLKALSTGFWQSKLDVAGPAPSDLDELQERRRALDMMDSGELDFGVMAFAAAFEGKRHVEAYVVHIPTMDDVLQQHASFFAPYALTPGTSVGEVLATVERMPRLDRFRAYGVLFGYPQYAVDFFVQAAADETDAASTVASTGETAKRTITPRDFVSVPVHEAATNRFVWAAPKGHAGHPEDDRIREHAAEILARYRTLREGPRPDGLVLLRIIQRDPQ